MSADFAESRLCGIFQNVDYALFSCRRPIKMSLLCQLEMTLPGGSAELAYEPSVLKRARSNNGSGFVGRCIGRRAGAALRRGSAPARRPTPTMVTSLSGRDSDISIWRTHQERADRAAGGRVVQPTGGTAFAAGAVSFSPSAVAGRGWRRAIRGQRRLHRQQAARDRPCRRAGRY